MKRIFILLSLMAVFNVARAGWLDSLGLSNGATNSTPSVNLSSLSDDQVVGGLKDALGNGLQHAISQLGHDDGFLTNLDVRIPMPAKLQTVEKGLKAVHQEKLADDFEATMNHAAEQAVPQAADVFVDAVKQMSFEDAKAILAGPQDAATQYFRRTTQTNLYVRFLPIVQQATSKCGVTSAYKKMLAGVNSSNNSLTGNLGGFANKYMGSDAVDLDGYVTSKALDGLFIMVADEEKRIRQDPVARTTDLMKQVFGAVQK
jgi:uncharacterized protein DUF4197